MARLASLFLLFLCFNVNVYAQPAHLLHQSHAVQFLYVDSITAQLKTPESPKGVNEINSLVAWAEGKDDPEFLILLKVARCAVERALISYKSSDIEKQLEELTAKAAGKYPYLEADISQELGTFYLERFNKNSAALEHYLHAYNIYKGFSPADFPEKRDFLFSLGGGCFRYGDYDNAEKYLIEALSTKDKEQSDITCTIYNTLGVCYQRAKKYDSSEFYLRAGLNYAISKNDSTWIGITGGNIGMTYFLQKKYAEAKPLLEQDMQLSIHYNQLRNAVGTMTLLANIYVINNNPEKAEQILLEAQKIGAGRAFWKDYSLLERFYTSMGKVYAAKGNMKLAYTYTDSALVAKDSSAAIQIASNLARGQEKMEYVQNKYEAGRIAGEKKLQTLIRNALIVVILLLTVIGILFINRQRLEQKKLEAEKKNAEAELDAAAAKLISYRQSMHEKEEILEQVNEELERLKKGEEDQADSETREQLEHAILLTDEQWEDFRKLFEKVHKGFFANLKKKMPDLTPAETRFLALTKLKLSSKEMAAMLGISPNAIRIYRHRLRKKLNLDKDDMIEELVESV